MGVDEKEGNSRPCEERGEGDRIIDFLFVMTEI
jgi:hypothetical protein